VIIASIGLSMGALGNQLYTMIVAMAVVTTMIMPPTLRWVLARVPLRDEEAKRLEKEEAEEHDSLPKMERALVYVDNGANGRLGASLAGMFAARQQVLTTVMEGPVDAVAEGEKYRRTGSRRMLRFKFWKERPRRRRAIPTRQPNCQPRS